MVSTTSSRPVSITETVSLLALATQTNRPSGEAARPELCRPTTISFTGRPCLGSTTETEPSDATCVLTSTRTGVARPEGPEGSSGSGCRPAQLLT